MDEIHNRSTSCVREVRSGWIDGKLLYSLAYRFRCEREIESSSLSRCRISLLVACAVRGMLEGVGSAVVKGVGLEGGGESVRRKPPGSLGSLGVGGSAESGVVEVAAMRGVVGVGCFACFLIAFERLRIECGVNAGHYGGVVVVMLVRL